VHGKDGFAKVPNESIATKKNVMVKPIKGSTRMA